MNIFIPHTHKQVKNEKSLFILTRPFYSNGEWCNDPITKTRWGISGVYQLVKNIKQADKVIIPFSINSYFLEKRKEELSALNNLCKQHNIIAYGLIVNDFGIAFSDFSNIIYLRANGFKSQLSNQNKGFPIALSDHYQRFFNKETIIPSEKKVIPIIGFCGHADFSILKRYKEKIIFFRENLKRFFKNPFRKDWEPIFSSAYERTIILNKLEKSSLLKTNFIYRNKYRAGAKSKDELEKTTLEYFTNIKNSDYIFCMRGAGNYSVRFFETLMMGKIPVFLNTDCILPFEDTIDWKKYVVWIEWEDRDKIVAIISEFHENLSNDDFVNLQINIRKLWKETLSINGLLQKLAHDI